MSIRKITAGAAVALAMSASAASAQIQDGGFETQGPAATSDYCYFGGISPACGATAPWNGSQGGGLQFEGNSAFPGTATPDGSYYGFIQGTGILAQTFAAATSGLFTIDFLAAGRPSSTFTGNQTYTVTLTDAAGAVQTLLTDSTTTFQPFTARSTSRFSLTAGSTYILSFNGQNPLGGDNTAFIDAVGLTAAVPEPATWGLMILGVGAVGGALRGSRRRTLAVA